MLLQLSSHLYAVQAGEFCYHQQTKKEALLGLLLQCTHDMHCCSALLSMAQHIRGEDAA